MAMMDPNVDPMLRFAAYKELGKLYGEFQRSRKPRYKHSLLKKHLIVAIRNFGRSLVKVGHRLEQV